LDLRFAPRELRKLDLLATEVVAAALASDERPPRGLAGLLDWRLSGRISALLARGFATGEPGEVLLLPGKPKLVFDKVLLFGVGARHDFTEGTYRVVLSKMLETLENLRARTAVIELPGRHFDAIAPERAAALLLEAAGGGAAHDYFTLVEPADAQRVITQRMIEQRRRER
jgi:Cytosol aminopeptidase family, N-terminal domain